MERESRRESDPLGVLTRRQGMAGDPVPKGCNSRSGGAPTLPGLEPHAPAKGTALGDRAQARMLSRSRGSSPGPAPPATYPRAAGRGAAAGGCPAPPSRSGRRRRRAAAGDGARMGRPVRTRTGPEPASARPPGRLLFMPRRPAPGGGSGSGGGRAGEQLPRPRGLPAPAGRTRRPSRADSGRGRHV